MADPELEPQDSALEFDDEEDTLDLVFTDEEVDEIEEVSWEWDGEHWRKRA